MTAERTAALAAAFAILATMKTTAQGETPITERDIAIAKRELASPYAVGAEYVIVVDAGEQSLVLWRDGEAIRKFKVSTGKAGLGCTDGSGKTPIGWHRIAEWIGRDALPGQVFVSRKPTGEVVPQEEWKSDAAADMVLTCIMWLEGLESGLNSGPGVDSHERYIYLHGTNQEHLLGRPASHGCIRLSNRDATELFHRTDGHETRCVIVR